MALVVKIEMPIETVAAIRNATDLDGAIEALAKSTSPMRAVSDAALLTIAAVKDLPYDIVPKIEQASPTTIGSSTPILTPASPEPDEELGETIIVTCRDRREECMEFNDDETLDEVASCWAGRTNNNVANFYLMFNDTKFEFGLGGVLKDVRLYDT